MRDSAFQGFEEAEEMQIAGRAQLDGECERAVEKQGVIALRVFRHVQWLGEDMQEKTFRRDKVQPRDAHRIHLKHCRHMCWM